MRLITQGPEHAFYNMALDEAISESVRQKLSPPTLRLYRWDQPSLSIGYFQRAADIDTSYCEQKSYPVVRRQTGGRAILHDAELTYSFCASAESLLFRGSLLENYRIISKAMLTGLELLGLKAKSSVSRRRNRNLKNPACFKAVSYGEITIDGKKIIGSAQKRFKNGFLQHGSILFRFDAQELSNALGSVDESDFMDIGGIADYAPEVTYSDLCKALKEAFEKELSVKIISDGPTDSEQNRARELQLTRYSDPSWNFLR